MKVRIVAAVVDTKRLILYKEDGKTIDIPQGDPRVRTIVDQVLPIVRDGRIAEVDLSLAIDNAYRDFEEKSGGIVRLFRTAKRAVSSIFGSDDEVTPGVFGDIPDANIGLTSAIDEIISNAEPVNTDTHDPKAMTEAQTMIAVVDGPKGKRIIPGVEKLVQQFGHSARNGNTKGVEALLIRMAGYIDKRAHSVEDLLKFLERGDLPIANDGSIIAYKRLYSVGGGGKDQYFVDPHTRKVRQRVGSFVCIPESMVDKNRRNECSHGLHIGRRGYMGRFSGNVMVLCKIAPEDVIVVPHGDPDKVRVCAYHILAELSEEAFREITNDRPMTSIPGLSKLLGQVIAGDHIGQIEQVLITGQRGEGVEITPLLGKPATRKALPSSAPATAIDDPVNVPAPVVADPKQVAAEVTSAKAAGGRQARAIQLMNAIEHSSNPSLVYDSAQKLVAHKKASKVSWTTLGITDAQATQAINIAQGPAPVPAKPVTKPKAKKAAKRSGKAAAKRPVAPKASVLEAPVRGPSASITKSEQSRLWRNQIDSSTLNDAQKAVVARQMLDSRRSWKKSWAALGLPATTDDELKAIINAAPIDVPHVAKVKSPAAARQTKILADKARKVKGGFVQLTAEPTGSTFDTDPAELALPQARRDAIAMVRENLKSLSEISRITGVHRRTIQRDVDRFGK
jgi:hypothetical protein